MKKDNIFLLSLIGVIVVVAFICSYFAFLQKSEEESVTDAMKIQREYAAWNEVVNENNQRKYPNVSLSDTNPFVFASEEEIIKLLESGTGIIYFGFANCPWCRSMIMELEASAKQKNLDKIYYFDISSIRDTLSLDENNKVVTEKQGDATYYKILDLLSDYLREYTLVTNDKDEIKTGEKRLFAPTVVAVSNGKISAFHEGTVESQKNGYDSLNDTQKKELQEIFKGVIDSFVTCKESC